MVLNKEDLPLPEGPSTTFNTPASNCSVRGPISLLSVLGLPKLLRVLMLRWRPRLLSSTGDRRLNKIFVGNVSGEMIEIFGILGSRGDTRTNVGLTRYRLTSETIPNAPTKTDITAKAFPVQCCGNPRDSITKSPL